MSMSFLRVTSLVSHPCKISNIYSVTISVSVLIRFFRKSYGDMSFGKTFVNTIASNFTASNLCMSRSFTFSSSSLEFLVIYSLIPAASFLMDLMSASVLEGIFLSASSLSFESACIFYNYR